MGYKTNSDYKTIIKLDIFKGTFRKADHDKFILKIKKIIRSHPQWSLRSFVKKIPALDYQRVSRVMRLPHNSVQSGQLITVYELLLILEVLMNDFDWIDRIEINSKGLRIYSKFIF